MQQPCVLGSLNCRVWIRVTGFGQHWEGDREINFLGVQPVTFKQFWETPDKGRWDLFWEQNDVNQSVSKLRLGTPLVIIQSVLTNNTDKRMLLLPWCRGLTHTVNHNQARDSVFPLFLFFFSDKRSSYQLLNGIINYLFSFGKNAYLHLIVKIIWALEKLFKTCFSVCCYVLLIQALGQL